MAGIWGTFTTKAYCGKSLMPPGLLHFLQSPWKKLKIPQLRLDFLPAEDYIIAQ
jgi:hypothetical protein